MKHYTLFSIALLFALQIFAQQTINPTPAKDRLDGIARRNKLQEKSYFNNLNFRNVGPTIMSGRAVDVDVNPDDPVSYTHLTLPTSDLV